MIFNQFRKYRQMIIFPHERKYFDEITDLFSLKYYRSAYIMSWVMLIEALRYRITILADSGEKTAVKLINKIETMEKEKLSVDKEIIEGAKSLSLIDNEDHGYFETFWVKRCLFVHPYNKLPTKAEVEVIIKICAEKVLSTSAYYRKSFIESEINNIYHKHYLVNDSKKIKEHVKKTLARIEPSLYSFFFKSVLFEIGKNINESGKLYILDRFSLYLQEIYKAASNEDRKNNFRIDFYITNFPNEIIFGLLNAETWNVFHEDLKNKIIQYVSENIRNQNYYLKSNQCVIELVVNNVIDYGECSELIDLLDSLYFPIIYGFVPFSDILIKSMLKELETYNFQRVITVVDYIQHIENEAYIGINNLLLLKLGRLLLFNADSRSWASQNFIEKLPTSTKKINHIIIVGMLFAQLFMYDMYMNINLNYLNYITNYLSNNVDSKIEYLHWFEIYKEAMSIKSPSTTNIELKDYLKKSFDMDHIDQNNLVTLEKLFGV